MLRMAGNKHAHEVAESSDLPVEFDDFLRLWSSFGINSNEFLKYLLTRIEVEKKRRNNQKHGRSKSLIYKPIPVC